jgi:uncharacterized LabA/DUF88 family protein
LKVYGFLDTGFLGHAAKAFLRSNSIDVSSYRRLEPQACLQLFESAAAELGGELHRLYWYDGRHPHGTSEEIAHREHRKSVALTNGIHYRCTTLRPIRDLPKGIATTLRELGWDERSFRRQWNLTGARWEQKGIDTLIVLDLVRLARRSAFDMAILCTGDRDLAEAVREAQSLGARVALVHPPRTKNSGIAFDLRALADHCIEPDSLHELGTLFS